LDGNGQKAVSDVLRMGIYSDKFKPKIKPMLGTIGADRDGLLYICQKKCCKRKRKKKIVQSGGAIATILAAVLPLIASLIFGKK
jgi:hypothetical protein